ncbi:GEA1 [Enterospora canceri]|uniref:GEA1 n=1 Tax=Enterospora canceri TaxID=1081671 RepID=A0A1Y1S8M5_9MICR|nr:GEA1 [Enterospora canceri]
MRLTNKEALYFLNIMNRHPVSICLGDLLGMKAHSADKYTSQVLVAYFTLCIKYFYDTGEFATHLNQKQKIDLFLKFIYVFEADVTRDIAVYNLFKVFLREEFFDAFIAYKNYRRFAFLKEFLVDFCDKLGDQIVMIGYDCPEYRQLIYTLQGGDWIADWANRISLSETFCKYDLMIFRKNKSIRRLLQVNNLYDELCNEFDVTGCDFDHIDENEIELKYERIIEMVEKKEAFKKEIENVNRGVYNNVDLSSMFLCDLVSLKALGEILCKEKNVELLREWTRMLCFKKMFLLDALRWFLSTFQMPGESQVIDRVLRVFAEVYCQQNGMIEDEQIRAIVREKLPENGSVDELIVTEYFKVTYSFVFLNTMLYKIHGDRKMPFREYYEKLETEIFTQDEMRKFYDDITTKEIQFPHHWTDGYDKYLVYKAYSESHKSLELSDTNGILAIYKYVFLNSPDLATKMTIVDYFRLCKIFSKLDQFEQFLKSIESDPDQLPNVIRGYCCLMEIRTLTVDQADSFADHLSKIEKPKPQGVFRSMFSTRHKINVLSQYSALYSEICDTKFTSTAVLEQNTQLLSKSDNLLVRTLSNTLVLNNIDLLENFTILDKETKFKFINRNPHKLIHLLENEQIEFLYRYFVLNDSTTQFSSETATGARKTNETTVLFYRQLLDVAQKTDDRENSLKLFNAFLSSCSKYHDIIIQKYDIFSSTVEVSEDEMSTVFFNEVFSNELATASNTMKYLMALKNSSTDLSRMAYQITKCSLLNDSKLNGYLSGILDRVADNLVYLSQLIVFLLNHNFNLNGNPATMSINWLVKQFVNRIKSVDAIDDTGGILFNNSKFIVECELMNEGMLETISAKTKED